MKRHTILEFRKFVRRFTAIRFHDVWMEFNVISCVYALFSVFIVFFLSVFCSFEFFFICFVSVAFIFPRCFSFQF